MLHPSTGKPSPQQLVDWKSVMPTISRQQGKSGAADKSGAITPPLATHLGQGTGVGGVQQLARAEPLGENIIRIRRL
jgi:hypothetical protein